MPTLGSVSGTYGYGRSPQNVPAPGIAIYPAIGTKRFWNFTTDGTFAFEANALTRAGTCYVITPNSSFSINVKMWGAGGGSGNASITAYRIASGSGYTSNNSQIQPTMSTYGPAGSGGYVYGKIALEAGQPYTIFTGGAGNPVTVVVGTSSLDRGGQGGAASGILKGNIFASSVSVIPVAIAGGGAGAPVESPANDYGYVLVGAGGGTDGQALVSSKQTNLSYNTTTNGSSIHSSDAVNFALGTPGYLGTPGLPTTFGATFALYYWGGYGGYAGGTGAGGGGGGGTPSSGGGGSVDVSGKGFVDSNQNELTTTTGMYSITSNYFDSSRGTAGDSDSSGRVVMYLDEYKISTIVASGGTETTVPIPGYELAYKYHTFTTNGKFVVNAASKIDTIDVFVVGAGGSIPVEGLYGAGGGGGVAFKSNLSISAGTYNVEVGTTRTGNNATYNFNGKASAFYTNNLAVYGFPDSYIKLINSFGGKIKYINAAGDDTDGSSIVTGYTSFNSAYLKNKTDRDLIVFVVLAGTYNESVSSASSTSGQQLLPTPIHDYNLPRIFVCAPTKVTISWTPTPASGGVPGASPMCQLMHPMSAVYGAIFDRLGYKQSSTTPSNLGDLAFFNTTSVIHNGITTPAIFRGSLYNCVFKDSTGDWGLFGTNPDVIKLMDFKIENCTFDTASNDIPLDTSGIRVSAIKLVDCIFKKSITHSVPNLINVAQNATIAAKYVVAAHTDKGVYAGEYGWGGTVTKPATTTKLISIVAPGGGAGAVRPFLELAQHAGGSGGGALNPVYGSPKSPAILSNKLISNNHSCFGHFGSTYGGGGGARYPAVDNEGGVGIEFPENSNVYYGCGGSTLEYPYGFTLSGNKFISIDHSTNTAAFTLNNSFVIEAWVKIINNDNTTVDFNIFNTKVSTWTGLRDGCSVNWNKTTQKFNLTMIASFGNQFSGGSAGLPYDTVLTTQNTYPLGTWYHVACVSYPGTGSAIFVNGILDTYNSSASGAPTVGSSSVSAQIGRLLPAGSIPPTGQIAGVHILAINSNTYTKYASSFDPPVRPFKADANTRLLIQGYLTDDCESSVNNFPLTLNGITAELNASPFVSNTNKDIYQLAPCDVGRGGGYNNSIGTAGTVMVRYVVPGPYTMPAVPVNKSIIAYGGNIIKTTGAYKEHVFTENGNFQLVATLPTGYFDVIVVGGGGSGSAASSSFREEFTVYKGGYGGQVTYQRVYFSTPQLINVVIGKGGEAAWVGTGVSESVGKPGYSSSFGNVVATNGLAGDTVVPIDFINYDLDGSAGVLITNGLFSDNTKYYGGGGGSYAEAKGTRTKIVGIGGSGGGRGTVGINGTSLYIPSTNFASNATGNGSGGGAGKVNGRSGIGSPGIVIIRYPIF
jgi:hypothetical protein